MFLPLAVALTFTLPDAAGKLHSENEFANYKATVFVFLAPECPLSRAVVAEVSAIHSAFALRGVNILGVNAALPLPFPDLRDPKNTIALQVGATVTPQAVVVSPRGAVLYSGRIDDRSLALGRTRRGTPRRDLRSAVEQVLAGKKPNPARTTPTGCSIEFAKPSSADGPVFSRDVAPILHRHCAPCHRPGESAPFALLIYQDAAVRASTLARVVRERLMPPWLPAPNAAHPFEGARVLEQDEIRALERWAAGGAPEGDPSETPAPPPTPEHWPLGKPDAILRVEAFPVPASGPDAYRCVVLPTPLAANRYVWAFDFRPGSPALHHALLFLDSTQAARRRDAETEGAGYPCFGTPGFLPSASLGGWTPGNSALAYPAGAAVRFRANADVVLQLHIHPDGVTDGEARPELALYFQDKPPARRMMDVALGSRRIDIPPGDARYIVRDHFTIPVPLEVTGIIPHAHYLAREMRGWAIRPDGSREDLIHIREWNFDWQQQYRYRKPFVLPADTRIEMEFVYDNSARNPHNPSSPPRRVVWGPDSTDEMAGLHVQVMPFNDEDASELAQTLWGRMMRERWGSIE
ncbi:MAG: hypothetical protein R2729_07080 [Bryobacteraceae bacterium]